MEHKTQTGQLIIELIVILLFLFSLGWIVGNFYSSTYKDIVKHEI